MRGIATKTVVSTYCSDILNNKNCVLEDIKIRLNSGDAYCHAFQSLLFSDVIFRSLEIKVKKKGKAIPVTGRGGL
jgi:hypothetical protein